MAQTEGNEQLKKGAIGTMPLVFMVIAAAAPLGAVAGNTPLVIGLGNGIAAPLDFLLVGILLLIFSVGYTAMSRHIVNAGAFYTYISAGLGKRLGSAAGYVATFSYSMLTIYCASASGYFASNTIQQTFGVTIPWWACSIVLFAVIYALGWCGIEAGATVLMVALSLEIAVLAALDIAVLVEKGASAFTLDSFSFTEFTKGAPGLGLTFAFLCFIGFEATAIFGEEVKDPKTTVKRATYIAVIIIGVIYVISSWAGIAAMGSSKIVTMAQGADAGTIYYVIAKNSLGTVFSTIYDWLFITSFLAAWLSSFNMSSRYIFAFGRNGLLPQSVARTQSRFKSPYVASTILTAVGLVIIIVYAVTGLDPYLDCAAIFSAIAVVGIIAVEAVAAISFIPYLLRKNGEEGFHYNRWTTTIAPALSAIGLIGILIMVIINFPLLTGSTNIAINLLPVLLLAIAVGGYLYARHLDMQGHPVDPMNIDVN